LVLPGGVVPSLQKHSVQLYRLNKNGKWLDAMNAANKNMQSDAPACIVCGRYHDA
jgi:hypothetical protein